MPFYLVLFSMDWFQVKEETRSPSCSKENGIWASEHVNIHRLSLSCLWVPLNIPTNIDVLAFIISKPKSLENNGFMNSLRLLPNTTRTSTNCVDKITLACKSVKETGSHQSLATLFFSSCIYIRLWPFTIHLISNCDSKSQTRLLAMGVSCTTKPQSM